MGACTVLTNRNPIERRPDHDDVLANPIELWKASRAAAAKTTGSHSTICRTGNAMDKTNLLDNVKHWRDRAETARVRASLVRA
jgi:hypothetical protein